MPWPENNSVLRIEQSEIHCSETNKIPLYFLNGVLKLGFPSNRFCAKLEPNLPEKRLQEHEIYYVAWKSFPRAAYFTYSVEGPIQ